MTYHQSPRKVFLELLDMLKETREVVRATGAWKNLENLDTVIRNAQALDPMALPDSSAPPNTTPTKAMEMPTDKPTMERPARIELPNGWYFTGDDFLGCRSLYRPGFETAVAYFESDDAQAFAAAMAPQGGLRTAFMQGAMACQVRCEDKGLKGGAEVCAEVITEWLLNGVTERLAATPAAQQAAPAVPHRAPYDVEISGGKETVIPAEQSAGGIPTSEQNQSEIDLANQFLDWLAEEDPGMVNGAVTINELTKLIAQHVQARTKPLVEALADMEGGLELMRMAIMGHADRTELTKRVNLLIKDCQKWQALAQEKGQADG